MKPSLTSQALDVLERTKNQPGIRVWFTRERLESWLCGDATFGTRRVYDDINYLASVAPPLRNGHEKTRDWRGTGVMSEERLQAIEGQAAHEGNYEFMLHGRQDIAALVAEVRRLRAENEGATPFSAEFRVWSTPEGER